MCELYIQKISESVSIKQMFIRIFIFSLQKLY